MTQVLSGTMYLAQGETINESDLIAYPAGTVAVTPPGTYHYMMAKDWDLRFWKSDPSPLAPNSQTTSGPLQTKSPALGGALIDLKVGLFWIQPDMGAHGNHICQKLHDLIRWAWQIGGFRLLVAGAQFCRHFIERLLGDVRYR